MPYNIHIYMEKKISIGMVGLGQFGIGFVELFKMHPKVARIALCDLDSKKLNDASKQFKISETYSNLDDICKSDLDALVIITQPWLHAPQAIKALKSGKHVYSAVPMMLSPEGNGNETLEWCDKLVEAVKQAGQLYMMGETTYYRPETIFCREKTKAFGQFVFSEAQYLHDTYLPACNLIDVIMARTGKSREEVLRTGGGVPMHYPTHSVSGPVSIMNARMAEVSAQGYIYPDDDYYRKDSITGNLFSNETALFKMSNGATTVIKEYRRVGHVGYEGITQVLGTDASFECRENIAKWLTKEKEEKIDVWKYRKKNFPLPEFPANNLGGHGGSHAYLANEFVEACCEERQPSVNAWEAAHYVAAGVKAHQSALKDGELLKIPDWGKAPDFSMEKT